MIDRAKVRPEILAKPCSRCGKPCPEKDTMLSFTRGEFVVFHHQCFQAELDELHAALADFGERGKA
jgi:hypothetical protein